MSLKKNILYSTILTVSNYLFPLFTYPYITRILGVELIGTCNFVDSVISYYLLFSMMGINVIGIREIAKNKNNRSKLNEVFSSLFLLNTISTFVIILILAISIFFVPKFSDFKDLFFIGLIRVLFNYLQIEWFFKGTENFKFVTNRTIIVKIIYVLSVFILVNKSSDYELYYLLTTLMVVVNAIINIYYSKENVTIKLKNINLRLYVKPFFVLGLYTLLTSMYTTFNVAYLGFITNNVEVGYYTTVTKLYTILISLFTAFTGVMMPKMSYLLSENKIEEFRNYINKAYEVLFAFSLPIIAICVVFASEIIYLLAGNGFEGSVSLLRIILPLLIIIGIEQVLVMQILMPLGKDKSVFLNSCAGAIIGIALNILLVPSLKSVGSALVWFSSEVTVLILSQYFVSKHTEISFPFKILFKNIVAILPVLLLLVGIYYYLNISKFSGLSLAVIITFIYVLYGQVYFVKNSTLIKFVSKFSLTKYIFPLK